MQQFNIQKLKLAVAAILLLFATVSTVAQTSKKNEMQVRVGKLTVGPKDHWDTMSIEFKLLKDGKKTFLHQLCQPNAITEKWFSVQEQGVDQQYWPKVISVMDIREKKSMAENLTIMLLIDRSSTVSDELLSNQFKVLKNFVASMPETKIYLSFMNNGTVTATQYVDSSTCEDWAYYEFNSDKKSGEKNLYRSIMSKLQELSGEEQNYFKDVAPASQINTDGEKILFVFTDGIVKDTATGEFFGGDEDFSYCKLDYYDRNTKVKNGSLPNIPVHCVYIGEPSQLDEELANELKFICSSGKEDEMKGKFYQTISADSLQEMMMGALDSLSSDYRMVLVNPDGKLYDGSKILCQISITEQSKPLAYGEKEYALGSKQSPITVSHEGINIWINIVKGFLLALIIVVLTYVILQYLIPALSYKHFLKKYVKKFSTDGTVMGQSCYFCKEPFGPDDLIVTKCQHVVHKECWDENRNRCPEYGVHKCSKGIHYYNQEKKSDPKNATHYLPWILFGLTAGALSWILFTILQPIGIFAPLLENITESLYPFAEKIGDEEKRLIIDNIIGRTQGWMLIGVCMGFFITLLLSYVLEFRKLDGKVIGSLLLRAVAGAVLGFAAFLLGTIIIIAMGQQYNCWWIDWVPWLFFAMTTALVLWFKSEIKLSSAILGGALSVLLSFVVMYLFTGTITSLFSYMIYAAGMGVSIAVVHFASEKYFLRVDGSIKERDIAIYKWMSVTGGFNKVSIGKSSNCVLQMNWDDSENIPDRGVELYLENDRPYCKVVDDGVTQQGRTLPKGTVIQLVHGSEFGIGKTRFTYIEKDK